MILTAKTLIPVLFALMLAGCGQSGPLYVPGDPSSVRTPPQAQQSSDEDSEDEAEDDDQ